MWARTHIHFTNGGEHLFAFLKPNVPGKWRLRRFDQGQEQSNTFLLMLQARGSPESNQDFVFARSQGIAVKTNRHCCDELQGRYAQETASHEQQPTRIINEKLRVARLDAAPKSKDSSGASKTWRTESWDTCKNFPEFLELESRHGVCLGQTYNSTHKCQNFTNERRDPRNIRNDSWMHQSHCACVWLFAAQINKDFMPRDGIFLSSCCFHVEISVQFTSFCGRKKKLLINFQTSFFSVVVGKKLLIKTEKANFSLKYDRFVLAQCPWSHEKVAQTRLNVFFFFLGGGGRSASTEGIYFGQLMDGVHMLQYPVNHHPARTNATKTLKSCQSNCNKTCGETLRAMDTWQVLLLTAPRDGDGGIPPGMEGFGRVYFCLKVRKETEFAIALTTGFHPAGKICSIFAGKVHSKSFQGVPENCFKPQTHFLAGVEG